MLAGTPVIGGLSPALRYHATKVVRVLISVGSNLYLSQDGNG